MHHSIVSICYKCYMSLNSILKCFIKGDYGSIRMYYMCISSNLY